MESNVTKFFLEIISGWFLNYSRIMCESSKVHVWTFQGSHLNLLRFASEPSKVHETPLQRLFFNGKNWHFIKWKIQKNIVRLFQEFLLSDNFWYSCLIDFINTPQIICKPIFRSCLYTVHTNWQNKNGKAWHFVRKEHVGIIFVV